MPDMVIGEWTYVECMKMARRDNNVDLVMGLANAQPIEQAMGQAMARARPSVPPVDDRASIRERNRKREEELAKAGFPTAALKTEGAKSDDGQAN